MDHGLEDHDFGSNLEAMIAEDPLRECPVRSMSRFDPVVKVSFASDIIRDDGAKLGKFVDDFYRLPIDVDTDVQCCISRAWLDLRLFGKKSVSRSRFIVLSISGGLWQSGE